jgi:putative DNA primase/helicase
MNQHPLSAEIESIPGLNVDALTQGPSSVLGVTDVAASNDVGFSETPTESSGVTRVSGPEASRLREQVLSESEVEPPLNVLVNEINRPCWGVYDAATETTTGKRLRPGVYLHALSSGSKGKAASPVDTWVCGPLHIDAQTFDENGDNFGRVLRFKNSRGKTRNWAMPMQLLSGGGDELRAELLGMGLEISPTDRDKLLQYLQSSAPKAEIRCAVRVGWSGRAFVLPDNVIGPEAEKVAFQSGERTSGEHGTGGTPEGWKTEVAAKAIGNPMLMLGLSGAFAGPLLKLTNTDGGGLHFVLDSSTGKTTILEAACSVWGGRSYRRSWRSTANGMEGAAMLFNDCLLALDEISECDPREIAAIVYALGNGRGKQRANRLGNARSIAQWRNFIISTGERMVATAMMEGNVRAKAGQTVRLLDVPAEGQYGCFDELHGFSDGAKFSDALKTSAQTHFGWASRQFLDRLTFEASNINELLQEIKAKPGFNAIDGEGQEKRAAAKFALVALAGELATAYDITGWERGDATRAAERGYSAWRSNRGQGNDERNQILRGLTDFVEKHGDSRFSAESDGMRTIVNRAGYIKFDTQGKRIYLFNASGMREALNGFDFKRSTNALALMGIIQKSSSGAAKSATHRINGHPARFYAVSEDALFGKDPELSGNGQSSPPGVT